MPFEFDEEDKIFRAPSATSVGRRGEHSMKVVRERRYWEAVTCYWAAVKDEMDRLTNDLIVRGIFQDIKL
jgi:hypothetical protein